MIREEINKDRKPEKKINELKSLSLKWLTRTDNSLVKLTEREKDSAY